MRCHRERGRDYDLPLPRQELTKHDIDELCRKHPYGFEKITPFWLEEPESIPGDRAPTYPCEREGCRGNIGQREGEWECDTCDWNPNE